MSSVRVDAFLRDAGTVLVFKGVEVETGDTVAFAADHRPGAVIVEAMYNQAEGIEPTEDIVADVPEWAVLSRGEHAS